MAPICMCCNFQEPRTLVRQGNVCPSERNADNALSCEKVGTCCHRSSLVDPNEALRENCAICNVYHPCDQAQCAARPVDIRNAQHNPMIIGLLISLLSNMYVIKS
eukprot:COSAG01_NODE_34852_length_541_cov_0.585973_2_plen_104_part_01